jgi:hypothetical protein
MAEISAASGSSGALDDGLGVRPCRSMKTWPDEDLAIRELPAQLMRGVHDEFPLR